MAKLRIALNTHALAVGRKIGGRNLGDHKYKSRRRNVSKFLSYVLRHNPDTIGIELDEAGWVDVNELLAGCERNGRHLTREELAEVVATNDKQRFAFSQDGRSIRASQGHSIPVDLGYAPTPPPAVLYHGTVEGNLPAITREGITKGDRHAVHLSPDRETAAKVGSRHGRPVVLEIDAAAMHADGHRFYLSANGVWLTEHVPPAYVSFPGRGRRRIVLSTPGGPNGVGIRNMPNRAPVAGNLPALHRAVVAGDKKMVESLLAEGGNANARDGRRQTPLHTLAASPPTDVREVFVAANAADLHGECPAQTIRSLPTGVPVYKVVQTVKPVADEILELLLSHGADVHAADEDGWTAMHCAADAGYTSGATILLAHGARPDVPCEPHGETPLQIAIARSHHETAQLLMSRRTDEEAQEKALCTAVAHRDAKLVEAILDRGVDPNVRGLSKRTCLHAAAERCMRSAKESVSILVRRC